jgi:hypothetical protein
MAALYNDGTVQYGSRQWIVHQPNGSTERDTYMCDNITINRPTKAVDRTNQLGEPSGSVGIADFVTGSATLQLDSGTAVEPCLGDRIICDGEVGYNANLDAGIGDEKFYITSVSRAEVKDGEIKINITFKKQYGA